MNRAFVIIFAPALSVAIGYLFVLRSLGFAPGYPRLVLPLVLLIGTIYGLRPKSAPKATVEKR